LLPARYALGKICLSILKTSVSNSLGEYSAYVAAGVLEFREAVRICRLRGQAMQEAVPRGMGGMMAVIGLDQATVEAICAEASAQGVVEPANYNAPEQTVISGLNSGLARAQELVEAKGGKAIRLPVSAPFHSRLLVPAGSVLSRALSGATLRPADFPVLANVDTEPCTEPQQIVPRLIQQVSRPVRFEQSVRRALAMGAEGFLELGPGKSLTSLIRKIDRKCSVAAVADPAGLAEGGLELKIVPLYLLDIEIFLKLGNSSKAGGSLLCGPSSAEESGPGSG